MERYTLNEILHNWNQFYWDRATKAKATSTPKIKFNHKFTICQEIHYLICIIRICQEVGLNGLKHSHALLFATFDLLLSDLGITFGVLDTSVLTDRASISSGYNFDMVRDWLKYVHQSITFYYAVTVSHIVLFKRINTVLHALVLASCKLYIWQKPINFSFLRRTYYIYIYREFWCISIEHIYMYIRI